MTTLLFLKVVLKNTGIQLHTLHIHLLQPCKIITRALDILLMVKKHKKENKNFRLGPPGFEPEPPEERRLANFLLMPYGFT